jgi:F5/8 type C domain
MRISSTQWRLLAALLAGSLTLSAGPILRSIPGSTATAAVLAGPNLAAGKSTSASSATQTYVASNVTDGNQGTYWESANNAFPQWVQVDLGSAQSASRVVLQLPLGWGARNQTLSIQGSTNGTNFSTLASGTYTFNPNSSNTVTITFSASTQRYFRVNITANTGWPAGQLSSLQVWNS